MAESAELQEPLVDGQKGWSRGALGAGLIFLLALAVYWPALRGQFVWDDTLLIDKNPLVKGELGLRSVWFQTDFPLTMIGFWVQWLAWGKSPAGYHAVNVLLHATSAVLVWRVLARLKIAGPWLAALVFAVHPVCVASVAWISELKNTLSLPFFLLSLWWYLRAEGQEESEVGSRRAEGGGQRPEVRGQRSEIRPPTSDLRPPTSGLTTQSWYWLSLAAFVLALLSKTSTVMLPVVLLGCAWWQRGRLTRLDCLRTSPFFVLALVFGSLSIWFQAHQAIGGEAVQAENFWGRFAGAGRAIWFYLGKALLPLDLNLMYPRWKIDAIAPSSYVPALLLCGAFILCWRFRRQWGRPVMFGLGCFAVTLFPVLGFFDMYFLSISRVSDHFQYLPMIAVVALIAAGLSSALSPRVLRFVGTGLVLALSALSAHRAQVLANDERLWRDTLAKNPAAWCAHNNLGCILAEHHQYDLAIGHFVASLELNPRDAQAHCNLGRALFVQGKFAEAQSHFQAALQIKPSDAEIHRSFASALAEQGKKEEAVAHLREAVRLGPDVETRLQLTALLHETGRAREAVEQCRQVLAIQPDSTEALNNLAWLLATCPDDTVRNGAEAVRVAERACRLTKYQEVVPLGTLAAAYAEAGQFNEAVATGEKSLRLATAAGDARFVALNRRLLEFYRAGKPWREPQATSKPAGKD